MWKGEDASRRDEALRLLAEFGFDEASANTALNNLSYGQQKMVAFAAGISSGARLLLLDEPTSGLSDLDTDRIIDHLGRVRGSGLTVIVVEHNLAVIRRCAGRVLLLDEGRVQLDGATEQVLAETTFQEAIFGHTS